MLILLCCLFDLPFQPLTMLFSWLGSQFIKHLGQGNSAYHECECLWLDKEANVVTCITLGNVQALCRPLARSPSHRSPSGIIIGDGWSLSSDNTLLQVPS